MVWQLRMLLGWSCSRVSEGSSTQPSPANLVLRSDGKRCRSGAERPQKEARGTQGRGRVPLVPQPRRARARRRRRRSPEGSGRARGPAAPSGRGLHPRRGRYLQQGDGAGEVPQGQELFQLRHLLPFLPPPVRRRRGTPHGRLGPGEHLGGEQSGAGSERDLGGASPAPGGGSAAPTPPPLTILPPGPGSSLRRRRRCQGNSGTAEGGRAHPRAAANRRRLATWRRRRPGFRCGGRRSAWRRREGVRPLGQSLQVLASRTREPLRPVA